MAGNRGTDFDAGPAAPGPIRRYRSQGAARRAFAADRRARQRGAGRGNQRPCWAVGPDLRRGSDRARDCAVEATEQIAGSGAASWRLTAGASAGTGRVEVAWLAALLDETARSLC